MSDIVYILPCKPGSVYLNITAKCLNNCLFCIKRYGPRFFGYDLSHSQNEITSEILIRELERKFGRSHFREVVFCGMGEPLLCYETVLEMCKYLKTKKQYKIQIRVDTSGLFWSQQQRIDILNWIDILSISLNAENAKKYDELCKPKIKKAYNILMDFIHAVKGYESIQKKCDLAFPEIRLSVVDTSEEEFIPPSGRKGYAKGTFPVPNFEACEKIAGSFGWRFIVKRLFRDSQDEIWNDTSFEKLCARGISPDYCSGCTYRH